MPIGTDGGRRQVRRDSFDARATSARWYWSQDSRSLPGRLQLPDGGAGPAAHAFARKPVPESASSATKTRLTNHTGIGLSRLPRQALHVAYL